MEIASPQDNQLIDLQNKLRAILSKNQVKAFPRQAFYDVIDLVSTQAKASQEEERVRIEGIIAKHAKLLDIEPFLEMLNEIRPSQDPTN